MSVAPAMRRVSCVAALVALAACSGTDQASASDAGPRAPLDVGVEDVGVEPQDAGTRPRPPLRDTCGPGVWCIERGVPSLATVSTARVLPGGRLAAVVDDLVAAYDGRAWRVHELPGVVAVSGLWASADADRISLMTRGADGPALVVLTGTRAVEHIAPVDEPLYGLVGPSQDRLCTMSLAAIYCWRDGRWRTFGTERGAFAISGLVSTDTDVFVVSTDHPLGATVWRVADAALEPVARLDEDRLVLDVTTATTADGVWVLRTASGARAALSVLRPDGTRVDVPLPPVADPIRLLALGRTINIQSPGGEHRLEGTPEAPRWVPDPRTVIDLEPTYRRYGVTWRLGQRWSRTDADGREQTWDRGMLVPYAGFLPTDDVVGFVATAPLRTVTLGLEGEWTEAEVSGVPSLGVTDVGLWADDRGGRAIAHVGRTALPFEGPTPRLDAARSLPDEPSVLGLTQDGTVWMAVGPSLLAVRDGEFTPVRLPDYNAGAIVRSVHLTDEGSLYVGLIDSSPAVLTQAVFVRREGTWRLLLEGSSANNAWPLVGGRSDEAICVHLTHLFCGTRRVLRRVIDAPDLVALHTEPDGTVVGVGPDTLAWADPQRVVGWSVRVPGRTVLRPIAGRRYADGVFRVLTRGGHVLRYTP